MASRRKVVRLATRPRKLVKAEKNRRLVKVATNHPGKLAWVEMKVRKPETPRCLTKLVRAAKADRN
jgi:heterodisulfide reductase subunit B